MNASSSDKPSSPTPERPVIPSPPAPLPGQLWVLTGVPGRHGVYLGDGIWKILVRSDAGEYSLAPACSAEPVELSPTQPAGVHWADEFDALARAEGLEITWEDEIRSYQHGALQMLGRL